MDSKKSIVMLTQSSRMEEKRNTNPPKAFFAYILQRLLVAVQRDKVVAVLGSVGGHSGLGVF